MATVKIEADGACQELHGVFQFTDDLFAEEMRQKEYIPPTYIPRTIRPQVLFCFHLCLLPILIASSCSLHLLVVYASFQ